MDKGLLIASIVAIVAIVGLVILFGGQSATGQTMACQQMISESGVGHIYCSTDVVYASFPMRYTVEDQMFAKYDQFNWDGQ